MRELPDVRRLRGKGRSWEDVVRYLNVRRPAATPVWTQERLVRAMRRFIAEGLAEKNLPTSAERSAAPDRLLRVAGMCTSIPRPCCRRSRHVSKRSASRRRAAALEARLGGAWGRTGKRLANRLGYR